MTPPAAEAAEGVVSLCLRRRGGGVRLGREKCVVVEFFLVRAGVFVLV